MTDDDVKEYAMETPEASIPIIVEKHKYAGFVVFDASIPAGSNFYQHMTVAFMHAIETALAFVGTDGLDEWIVAGRLGLAYIRSHPSFTETGVVRERLGNGLIRVGKLHSKTVYAMPGLQQVDMMIGRYGGAECCQVGISNGAFAIRS